MGGEKDKSKKVARSNEEIFQLVEKLDGKVDDLRDDVTVLKVTTKDSASKEWVRGQLVEQKAAQLQEEKDNRYNSWLTSPSLKRAKANALNAKAKFYIALAGAIGIAGTALASWLL
jgi:hypothetical protein